MRDAQSVGVAPGNAANTYTFEVVDVLRGVAALGVVVFHARVALWVGWREIQASPASYSLADRALSWLSLPAPFLGSLVMLFFVVSGFCVHQPVSRDEIPFRPGAFLRRRFLRIYPPYLCAVIVSFGFDSALLTEAARASGELLASVFMAQNYSGALHQSAMASQPASNPSLWSLPVEMELYLVYPIVRALVRAAGWGTALGVVGAVSALAVIGYHAGFGFLDGNFALYGPIWWAGAWLREQLAHGGLAAPSRAWGVAGLAAGACGVGLTLRHAGGVTNLCWGLFYFWIVWRLLAGSARWASGSNWISAGLRRLGRWSYSLYLLHFPLLLGLGALWVAWQGAKPANYLIPLAGGVAILPFVAVFYWLVERPSHRWARGSVPNARLAE